MMPRDMGKDAHAIANAEQLHLLLEDLGLTPSQTRPGYTASMRPADLTPVEIADQLARMYRADTGRREDAPSADERAALADYLGCHEEARELAWATWCGALAPSERNAAEYWLDVEFIQPCPEERPV